MKALDDSDVDLDFAEALTSTSVKQSKAREEFGTLCDPRLDIDDSWQESPASPCLSKSKTFKELSHPDNHQSSFQPKSILEQESESSSDSNSFKEAASEGHLDEQTNSQETFHHSVSQDPLNSLGPLQQSFQDPYNEDIWSAYRKAQDILTYQGGFQSGPEWSSADVLPASFQPLSVELLLARLRLFAPPSINNIQPWLENFDSILRLLCFSFRTPFLLRLPSPRYLHHFKSDMTLCLSGTFFPVMTFIKTSLATSSNPLKTLPTLSLRTSTATCLGSSRHQRAQTSSQSKDDF